MSFSRAIRHPIIGGTLNYDGPERTLGSIFAHDRTEFPKLLITHYIYKRISVEINRPSSFSLHCLLYKIISVSAFVVFWRGSLVWPSPSKIPFHSCNEFGCIRSHGGSVCKIALFIALVIPIAFKKQSLGFNPVLSPANTAAPREGNAPADIKVEQEFLAKADVLTFIYPI